MLEQMRADDRDEPSAAEAEILASEPPCDEGMLVVIEAWGMLNADRSVLLVPVKDGNRLLTLGIPFTAIDAWARRRGLDDAHAMLVADVISRLDAEHIVLQWNDLAT